MNQSECINTKDFALGPTIMFDYKDLSIMADIPHNPVSHSRLYLSVAWSNTEWPWGGDKLQY